MTPTSPKEDAFVLRPSSKEFEGFKLTLSRKRAINLHAVLGGFTLKPCTDVQWVVIQLSKLEDFSLVLLRTFDLFPGVRRDPGFPQTPGPPQAVRKSRK